MATIKAFTTIEQSRKLAEILPLESADMVLWGKDFKSVYADVHAKEFMKGLECRKMNYVPCWSLAALFGVLPNKIVSHETAFEGEDAEGINDIYHKCIELTEDEHYMCCYLGNGCKYKCVADNPVDACVAMVEKLHELNLL